MASFPDIVLDDLDEKSLDSGPDATDRSTLKKLRVVAANSVRKAATEQVDGEQGEAALKKQLKEKLERYELREVASILRLMLAKGFSIDSLVESKFFFNKYKGVASQHLRFGLSEPVLEIQNLIEGRVDLSDLPDFEEMLNYNILLLLRGPQSNDQEGVCESDMNIGRVVNIIVLWGENMDFSAVIEKSYQNHLEAGDDERAGVIKDYFKDYLS